MLKPPFPLHLLSLLRLRPHQLHAGIVLHLLRCTPADEGRNDCADEGWSDRGEGGSHSGGGCRGCGGAAEIEVAVRLRCGGGGENEWWWVSAVFLRT
jgi:hypothetical protein